MKGINKLAAVLCLLMLPNTVFAAQADRPQHPKTVVSSTQHDTPQTPPTNKTSVSAAPTKTNIPIDVKIVSDLGSDFSKLTTKSEITHQENMTLLSCFYPIYRPHNNYYIGLIAEKIRIVGNTHTVLRIVIADPSEIVLKLKKSPYFITINQGLVQKKTANKK